MVHWPGCGLDDRGTGLRFKAETRDNSLLHSVQTHASVLSQCHSPEVKRPELGTDNSLDLLITLLFFVTVLKLTCGLHNVILMDFSAQSRNRLEGPSSLIRNGWSGCFSGNKAPWRGVMHSPKSSVEVKNEWSNVFTLYTPSWPGQQQVYLHIYLSQCTGVTCSGTSTPKCSLMASVAAESTSSMWPRWILCSCKQQWKIFRSPTRRRLTVC